MKQYDERNMGHPPIDSTAQPPVTDDEPVDCGRKRRLAMILMRLP
jgi:hypothetical protein